MSKTGNSMSETEKEMCRKWNEDDDSIKMFILYNSLSTNKKNNIGKKFTDKTN